MQSGLFKIMKIYRNQTSIRCPSKLGCAKLQFLLRVQGFYNCQENFTYQPAVLHKSPCCLFVSLANCHVPSLYASFPLFCIIFLCLLDMKWKLGVATHKSVIFPLLSFFWMRFWHCDLLTVQYLLFPFSWTFCLWSPV